MSNARVECIVKSGCSVSLAVFAYLFWCFIKTVIRFVLENRCHLRSNIITSLGESNFTSLSQSLVRHEIWLWPVKTRIHLLLTKAVHFWAIACFKRSNSSLKYQKWTIFLRASTSDNLHHGTNRFKMKECAWYKSFMHHNIRLLGRSYYNDYNDPFYVRYENSKYWSPILTVL